MSIKTKRLPSTQNPKFPMPLALGNCSLCLMQWTGDLTLLPWSNHLYTAHIKSTFLIYSDRIYGPGYSTVILLDYGSTAGFIGRMAQWLPIYKKTKTFLPVREHFILDFTITEGISPIWLHLLINVISP